MSSSDNRLEEDDNLADANSPTTDSNQPVVEPENAEQIKKTNDENVANAPIENLIADIFGDSDDEEYDSTKTQKLHRLGSDDEDAENYGRNKLVHDDDDEEILSEDEDGHYSTSHQTDANFDLKKSKSQSKPVKPITKKDLFDVSNEKFTYDFDKVMQKRRLFNRLSRKRNNQDFDDINDNDDHAFKLIEDMMNAAKDDRESNEQGKIALKKLNLLNTIRSQVLRADMTKCLVEQGLYQAFYNWLIPLPDGSLPHLKIRTTILTLFEHLNTPRPNELKKTGLGKVINMLSKHPNESRQNKQIARQLISDWSRIIFGLDKHLTSSEHDEISSNRRLYDSQAYNRNLYLESMNSQQKKDDSLNTSTIPRARVPQPSSKDYVNRPVSNVSKGQPSVMNVNVSYQNSSLTNINKKLKRIRKAK